MAISHVNLIRGNNLALRDGPLAISSVSLVFCEAGPILFDTGQFTARRHLLRQLAAHDLTAADVKAVFLSHLHFDHCHNVDLFPGARIFLSRTEWDYAAAPHPNDMAIPWLIREQLQRNDITLLEGEGELCPGLRYFPAPGHTPGSTALRFEGADGVVVLAGDAVKSPAEILRGRSELSYGDPDLGVATIARIVADADIIVPGHFQQLRKHGDRFVWDESNELGVVIR